MATAYTIGSVTVILVAHLLLSCPRCIVIWICTRIDPSVMQTHSITLGMNIPNAGTVTNQMWIQFLNDTVLASLEYATITDAIGIYKGTLEKSKVISITTEDPAAVDALRKVGDAYKTAFNQESVMYAVQAVPILQFT